MKKKEEPCDEVMEKIVDDPEFVRWEAELFWHFLHEEEHNLVCGFAKKKYSKEQLQPLVDKIREKTFFWLPNWNYKKFGVIPEIIVILNLIISIILLR